MYVAYSVVFDLAQILMEQIKQPPHFLKQFQNDLQLVYYISNILDLCIRQLKARQHLLHVYLVFFIYRESIKMLDKTSWGKGSDQGHFDHLLSRIRKALKEVPLPKGPLNG